MAAIFQTKLLLGVKNKTPASIFLHTAEKGNLIVFDCDHSCHVVDSNGKTILGSASNYYMGGDRVVMAG